jgi:hypothetical protein
MSHDIRGRGGGFAPRGEASTRSEGDQLTEVIGYGREVAYYVI